MPKSKPGGNWNDHRMTLNGMMWALGDRAYSYPPVRRWCERRSNWDVIPQRSDQAQREGRRVFSPAIYSGRTVVELRMWERCHEGSGRRRMSRAAYRRRMVDEVAEGV